MCATLQILYPTPPRVCCSRAGHLSYWKPTRLLRHSFLEPTLGAEKVFLTHTHKAKRAIRSTIHATMSDKARTNGLSASIEGPARKKAKSNGMQTDLFSFFTTTKKAADHKTKQLKKDTGNTPDRKEEFFFGHCPNYLSPPTHIPA